MKRCRVIGLLVLGILPGVMTAGSPEGALSYIIETVQPDEKPEQKAEVTPEKVEPALNEVIVSNPSLTLRPLNYISTAFATDGFYDTGYLSTGTRLGSGLNPGYQGVFHLAPGERITSDFGYRESFHRVHLGVDIAMAEGDTVRVPLPGVVFSRSYDADGYGHCVVVKHRNGMETRYAHLSKPLVAEGQRLVAGDAVALSGNTGNSTGPHLHFETRYLGVPIDPRSVFDFTKF